MAKAHIAIALNLAWAQYIQFMEKSIRSTNQEADSLQCLQPHLYLVNILESSINFQDEQ